MKRLSAALAAQVLLALVAAGPAEIGTSDAWAQRRGNRARRAQPARTTTTITAERKALIGTVIKAAVVAADTLGEIREPEALATLLDALALGLHPRVAAAALDAVGKHGDIRAYDAIAFYLRYREPRVRAAAVRAMGRFDDPRVPSHVLAALTDADEAVRKAAIEVVAARALRPGIEPMLELLKRGDEATAPALAAMASPDLAKSLGEFIGVAPDFLLARALGSILRKPDFGPETARVQVVRTLAKVPGNEAVAQLTAYVQEIPETPPRQSRREAQATIKSRLSGGNAGAGGK